VDMPSCLLGGPPTRSSTRPEPLYRHATTTGMGRSNGNPNEKTPQFVFKCGSESGCALVAVKMADGRGWSYNEPKLKASEQARIAVVYFDSKLAE